MPFIHPPAKAASISTFLAAVLLLAAGAACAQASFEDEVDDKDKPWQEIEIELPAAPSAADLLPFYVSPTATQSFAVDAKSVSVGADGVVRYTLVATSQAGARNVSYEGIRCQSFEKKLYAFGHPDGSWARSRHSQWVRITDNISNRQHAALAKDYFCDGPAIAGRTEDIVKRLRKQQTLAPQKDR